jgi:hypothetical protein
MKGTKGLEQRKTRGDAMRPMNTSELAKNWFRAVTLCLTSGFFIRAGYSFPNQDLPGQERAFLKETASVATRPTRPEMEEFLRRAQVIRQKPLSVGVTNSQRATAVSSTMPIFKPWTSARLPSRQTVARSLTFVTATNTTWVLPSSIVARLPEPLPKHRGLPVGPGRRE